MAAVYEASDLGLGRVVAVKLFRLDQAEDAGAARQSDEVMVLAHLNHFALVTLYDAGTEAIGGIQRSFIVTEFVNGSDLRSRIQDGPLDPAEVAGLGADLCEAVHYMHSQGVIHRDIKPANVLLATTDFPGRVARAKLADFGIARLFDATHQTKAGTVIGTAGYLSPEQAGGLPVGPASDVYSLGLVLLESLTAERCYSGTAAETALARLRRQPDVPDWLGDDWRELLTGMTARAAEHRLSPADAAVRLLALAHGTGGVPSVGTRSIDVPTTAPAATVLPDTVLPTIVQSAAALPTTALPTTAPPAAMLPETVLQAAVVPETALPRTLLQGAALPQPVLPEMVLPETELQETVLPEAELPEAELSEPVLPQPELQGTVLPKTLLLKEVAPPASTPVRETIRKDIRKHGRDEAKDSASPRRWPLVLSGILVVLVTIAMVLFTVPGTAPAPEPPAYPAVGGQLGDHLEQLQESLNP